MALQQVFVQEQAFVCFEKLDADLCNFGDAEGTVLGILVILDQFDYIR
jgi:hypothetical protein